MIGRKDLNSHGYILTTEQELNLNTLAERLTRLGDAGCPITMITSGLRSEADQRRINPKSMHSQHLIGAAADVYDPDHYVREWCLENVPTLEKVGLWCEDPASTPTWMHFQIFPPKSGSRFFKP